MQRVNVIPLVAASTENTQQSSEGHSPLVADAKTLTVVLGGIGLRTVRSLDAAGKMPRPIRVGGRVVWMLDEIREWLKAGAPDRETWETRKKADKARGK